MRKFLRPSGGKTLGSGLLVLVAAFGLAACGGQAHKRISATSATSFPVPNLQAITPADTSWVAQDWEATVNTRVKCSFISSDPVMVAASAGTYGVAGGSSSLLNNPAEMSPGQVMEFACGKATAPRTAWFLWYENVNSIAVLLALADQEAHHDGRVALRA